MTFKSIPSITAVSIGILLSSLIWISCGDTLGNFLISNQQEIEMGQSVDEQIESEYHILEDSDPVAKWARDLVKQLQDASVSFRDPDEFGGFKVEVIADNELVNAFAAPGGYTYISTGLIIKAHRCAEIGGVMGHEIAHVTQRHSVNAMAEQYGVQTMASWFLGDSLLGDAAVLVYNFLLNTTFSQENEAEADSIGLQIAYNAGYNPYGLVDFFDILLAMEQESGVSMPQFLSSHPATKDRIKNISAEIQQRYGDKVIREETQTYDCIGTDLSLEEVQQRINDNQISIRN